MGREKEPIALPSKLTIRLQEQNLWMQKCLIKMCSIVTNNKSSIKHGGEGKFYTYSHGQYKNHCVEFTEYLFMTHLWKKIDILWYLS